MVTDLNKSINKIFCLFPYILFWFSHFPTYFKITLYKFQTPIMTLSSITQSHFLKISKSATNTYFFFTNIILKIVP